MNDLAVFTKSGVVEKGGSQQKAIAAIGASYGVELTKNKGFGNGSKKLILAFDATGSMSGIWQTARAGIEKLLARLHQLYPDISILLVAYRDYSDGNKIIERSKVTSDPEQLKTFLQNIYCGGGGDEPEAVEVALEKILQQEPGAAVIVGDAPPHGVNDNMLNGKDFRKICQKLSQANVPVHTVSTNQDTATIQAFSEIAQITKGFHVPLEEMGSLVDVLSFTTAESLGSMQELIDLVKQEQNGRLTAAQEKIFRLSQ